MRVLSLGTITAWVRLITRHDLNWHRVDTHEQMRLGENGGRLHPLVKDESGHENANDTPARAESLFQQRGLNLERRRFHNVRTHRLIPAPAWPRPHRIGCVARLLCYSRFVERTISTIDRIPAGKDMPMYNLSQQVKLGGAPIANADSGSARIPLRARTVARALAVASVAFLGLLGISIPQQAAAGEATEYPTNAPTEPKREWAASFRWENDAFGGMDQFYTDGIALGVSHTGPSWMDPVANWLPWGEGRRTVGYDLAQAMFTPSDKDLSPPDPNDRPYAGILALGDAVCGEAHDYHGLKFITGVVALVRGGPPERGA
jgi:hypothetical protein